MEKILKIIPLGGLGEVGRNLTLFEYGGKILVVDMGLGFPEETMPGIDFVIPNTKYLKERKKDIVGIIFTHGHYDHIGAIPYVIKRIGRVPMYASSLTKGIILKRQEDFSDQPKLKINLIEDRKKINLSPFKIEPFRQNHNIPGNFGLFIETPLGNVIFTSDFKFDPDPVYDPPTDFKRLAHFGKKGVLLLLSSSTRAEEKGHSLSEKTIMNNLDKIFKNHKGRIIASTFASNLNRIHQLISLSEKYQRKVALDGFSLKSNVEIALNLKYFKIKKEIFIPPKKIKDIPENRLTFICTGAQGEEEAILMRIANSQYKYLSLRENDIVIFSSSIIPGNERRVQYLKDSFYREGAEVYHYQMMDIHASGHGHQEELKEMIRLTKPKFLIPIHGQYSMLVAHKKLALALGMKEANIVVADNGDIINVSKEKIWISQKKAPAGLVMVDGLGVGDIGEVVLRDRNLLAKDGIFVLIVVVDKEEGKVRGSPDIISRGFIYLRESKKLLSQTRKKTVSIVNGIIGRGGAVNWFYVKEQLKDRIGEFLFKKTKRRPMVLPVIIEV